MLIPTGAFYISYLRISSDLRFVRNVMIDICARHLAEISRLLHKSCDWRFDFSCGDARCAVLAAAAAGAARRPRTAVHAGPGYRGQAAGGRCGRRDTATRESRFCTFEEFQFVESSLEACPVFSVDNSN